MSKTFFKEKKEHIEIFLRQYISEHFDSGELKNACLYSISTGGKRLRPLIVYLIGKALCSEAKLDACAGCVELFHTASLIADDLPCMDNEDLRRDKPTLHKAFDDATALLASYALIVAAFEMIYLSTQESLLEDKEVRGLHALKEVSNAAGAQGATGGQFLDLFQNELNLKNLEEIVYKKTVVLFEVAFVLGWLFSGGKLELVPIVKKAAIDLGFAFQLIDDVLDEEQDTMKTLTTNMSCFLGKETTEKRIFKHLQDCENTLETLGIRSEEFVYLLESLKKYLKEKEPLETKGS